MASCWRCSLCAFDRPVVQQVAINLRGRAWFCLGITTRPTARSVVGGFRLGTPSVPQPPREFDERSTRESRRRLLDVQMGAWPHHCIVLYGPWRLRVRVLLFLDLGYSSVAFTLMGA